MTKKKKHLIVSGVGVIAFLLVSILAVVYFPTIMNFLITEEPSSSQPKIEYGEFPIRIEYLVNGETRVVEDILVCRFEGIQENNWLEKANTGRSFKRIWQGELKNHVGDIILLSDSKLTIDFSLGSADYYMGDIDINTTYPSFRIFKNQTDGRVLHKFLFSAEELRDYGIEIVECVLPEPIKNSFGENKR